MLFRSDLALELVLRLLSSTGLDAVRVVCEQTPKRKRGPHARRFLDEFDRYRASIDGVIAFLQGRDSTLAHRIASRQFLPEGSRFASLDNYVAEQEGGDPLAWAFGALGTSDRARHFATLYLNDLGDVVREAIDPRFEFVRYAERLAASAPSFDPLAAALAAPRSLIDEWLHELTVEIGRAHV